ncbi:MAG: TVP38/TMEM64 family protein [Gammaproteobacteria bacterium]
MTRALSPAWGLALSILFIASVVGFLVYLDVHEQVLLLLKWLDELGNWASLLFILIMALVVVMLLPGVFFTMGAGFVFGVVEGTIYVVIGTTLGAMLAYLMARHWFGARATHYILNHPRLKLVSDEFTSKAWRVVLLTRLIPFFPFKLSNYFFGVTRFTLRDFTIGTFIGVIPLSLNSVYLGSITADIAMLGSRNGQRSPLEWTIYGIGFVVAVAALIYFNRLAQRALAKYTDKQQGEK